jgi:hypothetical protein
MDVAELAAIGVTVFVTAVLSGVLGMAGGIALLGVLLIELPPLVAIPLHGVIQLVSKARASSCSDSMRASTGSPGMHCR